MKLKGKKIISIIFLIITIVTALPLGAFATFITDINSNAEFGVIGGSLKKYGHELHYANYDGGTYLLFCTEFGIKSPTGRAYSYGDEFFAALKEHRPELERMAEMIYFGYAMNYGLGLPESYEAQRDACATQQYVWEMLGIGPTRDSWNGDYMSYEIYDDWFQRAENNYNQYHSRVSFDESWNTINLGETTTLWDNNGVLANFDNFYITINGVDFAHERWSNELKVTTTNESNIGGVSFNSADYGIYELLPNGAGYSNETMSNYVYFEFYSGSVQNLMFSNYVNPIAFNVSVDVQVGQLQIKKINNLGNPVVNCGFEVYTDEECNQCIANGLSDENGQLFFDNLKAGTYWIKETSVPEGYLLDTNIQRVDVTGGQVATVEFKNNKPTGTIIIDKSVSLRKNVDTSLINKEDLSAIEFELTAKEDIIDNAEGNVIYKKGQEIGKYNLNKNGNLTISNLPMGVYELQEVKTADGLILNNKKYEIKFTQKDLVTKVYEDKKNIVNDTTLFEISKTDITGDKELEGAKLTILDENGKIIDTWVSKKTSHKIEGLIVGKTYTLREEIAPNGYVRATDIKFKVKSTKEVQKVQMKDKVVEVTKTDFINSEEIEGAELEVIDEKGKVVDKWTSNKKAHKIKGLQEGKTYKLIEKIAPYGYEIANEIEFKVSSEKETQKIEMKDMPILKDIKLIKIDASTKESINENFTFGLYEDESCTKLIQQVDSNKDEGTITFEDLRYGTYYIKEITAPDGYLKSDETIKIEINDKGVFVNKELAKEVSNKVYSFEFENVKIPKTGENRNTNIYLVIFVILTFSSVGIGIYEHQKKKNNKK